MDTVFTVFGGMINSFECKEIRFIIRQLNFERSVQREETSLDVFFSVIPSPTSITGRNGHLDSRDNTAWEKSGNNLWSKHNTKDDWGAHDQDTRWDHLVKRGFGGNGNTGLVVRDDGTILDAWLFLDLTSNFFDHLKSGLTDRFHGHGGEGVGEHGADNETGEDQRISNDNGLVTEGIAELAFGTQVVLVHGSGDEGTEEGHTDKGGRSNGETFTDSGSGVTSRVESISLFSQEFTKGAHFSNTTGIIGNWAVGINCETN